MSDKVLFKKLSETFIGAMAMIKDSGIDAQDYILKIMSKLILINLIQHKLPTELLEVVGSNLRNEGGGTLGLLTPDEMRRLFREILKELEEKGDSI